MRKSSNPLMNSAFAAALMMASSAIGEPKPLRTAYPKRERYIPPRNTELQKEIADWNAAVDLKKAEKAARKARK